MAVGVAAPVEAVSEPQIQQLDSAIRRVERVRAKFLLLLRITQVGILFLHDAQPQRQSAKHTHR